PNALDKNAHWFSGRWPSAFHVECLGVLAFSATGAHRQAAVGLDYLVRIEIARLAIAGEDSGRRLARHTLGKANAGADLAAALESQARRCLAADKRGVHLGNNSANVRRSP